MGPLGMSKSAPLIATVDMWLHPTAIFLQRNLFHGAQGVEGGNAEADMKLVLADIIADVSCADSAALVEPAARETDAAAPGDALMDEDFQEPAQEHGVHMVKTSRSVRNIMDGALTLAPGEYEELMQSMEESLFEDMRRDEAAFLAEQERWEAAAAEAEVSMLVRIWFCVFADGETRSSSLLDSAEGRLPCHTACDLFLLQFPIVLHKLEVCR